MVIDVYIYTFLYVPRANHSFMKQVEEKLRKKNKGYSERQKEKHKENMNMEI